MILLHTLSKISEKTLTIIELLKLTDLSRTSISTSLKRLVSDELVDVKKEKRVKYFSPNPIFTEKFMKQPKELLNKEIIPLVKIVEDLSANKASEDYKNKLLKIKKDLKNLENLLDIIIKIERKTKP